MKTIDNPQGHAGRAQEEAAVYHTHSVGVVDAVQQFPGFVPQLQGNGQYVFPVNALFSELTDSQLGMEAVFK
jgi:hypothetical protein